MLRALIEIRAVERMLSIAKKITAAYSLQRDRIARSWIAEAMFRDLKGRDWASIRTKDMCANLVEPVKADLPGISRHAPELVCLNIQR